MLKGQEYMHDSGEVLKGQQYIHDSAKCQRDNNISAIARTVKGTQWLRSPADMRILRVPHVRTMPLDNAVLLLCSKAMEFAPFCHPSHLILPCIQNCIKNDVIKMTKNYGEHDLLTCHYEQIQTRDIGVVLSASA